MKYFSLAAAQTVPVTSNIDIDNLKAKIAAIKADIRSEQGMCEGVSSEQLEVRYIMYAIPDWARASFTERRSGSFSPDLMSERNGDLQYSIYLSAHKSSQPSL